MSVTYDYASGIDAYGATITLSHTCAGSDRYLLAFATIRGSGDKLSGVTYGGVAMTRLFRANVGSVSLYAYGLAAPAVGTANIVYTQTSAGTLSAASVSSTGVNQSATPYATGNANAYMSSPQSISVTSSTGDAGISYISGVSADSADFVAESGQTEVFQSSSGELRSVGFKTDPASVGWTWSGGLQKGGGHIAVVLASAGGGATTHEITISNAAQSNTVSDVAIDNAVAGTHNITIASAQQGNALSTAAIQQATPGSGTITTPEIRDWETRNLKTSLTGVQVDIRSISTGALIVRKTGLTTHATTAVCVITDAAIPNATLCEVVVRCQDGSVGIWDLMSV